MKAKKSSKQKSTTGSTPNDVPPLVDEARYVGCFSSENYFLDRNYGGGSTGASYNLALHHAKTSRKKYFAISRSGPDGHAFAFSALNEAMGSAKGNMHGGGCENPCADLENKVCGCADLACTGRTPPGEEHNRRWAVYEMIGSKK